MISTNDACDPERVSEEVLVGTSEQVVSLRKEILAIASSESTVLITGETGTGKGLVARLIYQLSKRAKERFVHVDCAALSSSVIESELFGHERGAFTGAISTRQGRFELAERGTIFLDEVGELDAGLQKKLLRVLQDREYERIGGTKTLKMSARVFAATNCDLAREVQEGRFRPDLYFRLNVIQLKVSALRERCEDIPPLIALGLRRLSRQIGVAEPTVSFDAISKLAAHTWPGNVRELMNLLESILVRWQGRAIDSEIVDIALRNTVSISRNQSSFAASSSWYTLHSDRYLEAHSVDPNPSDKSPYKDSITAALIATGGNVARASRKLRMPRSTLRYWIRQHGLETLTLKD
jgi:two-component system response regulator AtoC